LLKEVVRAGALSDSIVLDFFAGSASMAHAVMALNAEDGGSRRHISVQLPESCVENSEASKAGFTTIAEIAKERIRRSGKTTKEAAGLHGGSLDIGFRVLKVDTSNMKDVYYQPDAVTQATLAGLVDNVKDDRTDEDLLFQVLLDWGVDLTLPIKPEKISGKKVYFVDTNALAACFEPGIDEAFIKELAKQKPLRVVFRDTGYGSDATKINVEQIFKLLSPATEVKSI
jgi:adenine-specific DNA-methyltransferase